MDFLPKRCRICENGKYTLKEFNKLKAAEYLESIGRTLHPYETFANYCTSAICYATANNEDPKQFYEMNEYTCAYKDECKFAKI